MMSYDLLPPANNYPIDITSGAEIARLIDQSSLMLHVLGSLLPKQIDLTHVERIVDLACGPGGWANEFAYQYPEIAVIGIDCSEAVIAYARALAKVQQLQNVSFWQTDIKEPLEFSDNSIDLVHARFLAAVLDQVSWPQIMRECYRILKPSGVLLLTECEGIHTNSRALHHLQASLFHSFYQQGRTFSLDGHSLGITHMLDSFLQQAGFTSLEKQPFVIDASYGSPNWYEALKNTETLFALLKPYLLKTSVIEEQIFDLLYQQLTAEIRQQDYISLQFGLQAWGYKKVLMPGPSP
jgi:ubiquinone/menaquinone biosynthesis C-methylase UbiE